MIVAPFFCWPSGLSEHSERTRSQCHPRSTLNATDLPIVFVMISWFRTSSYASRDSLLRSSNTSGSSPSSLNSIFFLELQCVSLWKSMISIAYWKVFSIDIRSRTSSWILSSDYMVTIIESVISDKLSRRTRIKQVNTLRSQQERVNMIRAANPISYHGDMCTWLLRGWKISTYQEMGIRRVSSDPTTSFVDSISRWISFSGSQHPSEDVHSQRVDITIPPRTCIFCTEFKSKDILQIPR